MNTPLHDTPSLLATIGELSLQLTLGEDDKTATLTAWLGDNAASQIEPYRTKIETTFTEPQGLLLAEYFGLETHEFTLHELVNELLLNLRKHATPLREIGGALQEASL